MADQNFTGLSEWYLARLRQQAARRERDQAKMTPHTMVETDINLIKDMVSRTSATRERRSIMLLDELRKAGDKTRNAHKVITGISMFGSVLLLILLIKSWL